MEKVKLLQVVGDSKFGGASRIVIALSLAAKAEGWEVAIVGTDPAFQAAIREAGLDAVGLDVARRALNPWRDLRDLLRLRQFLRGGRYTIVHTHTSKGGFLGRLAARLAGVPVVIHTAHGFAIHETSPARHRIPYAVLERIASWFCDRIVAVSEFHRDWGIRLGIGRRGKTIAIPNGIPPERVGVSRAVEATRRDWGVEQGEIAVLVPGRLAPQKGLEALIEAFAILAARGAPPARLVIAGDGPLRQELEARAKRLGLAGVVRFLGFREDVGNLLAAADLVVLPSIREGLSIALLEAMAAGKPVIAASIGSNREVAAKCGCLLLVRPGDVASLGDAIQLCCQDPHLRLRLAERAHTVFHAWYTEHDMVAAYRRLYYELLEARGIAVSTGLARMRGAA